MELELPQLATFKYKHGGRVPLTGKRKVFLWGSLIVATIIAIVAFPVGLLALAVPVVAYYFRQGMLMLGARYLICGDDIIYFTNVTQMTLLEAEGRLTLKMANGKNFTLDREKFPTNARKANKIAANQAAKFGKVSAKVMEKVRRASPATDAAASTA